MSDDLLCTFLQTVLAGRTTGMALTLSAMAAQVTGGVWTIPVVEALAAECALALNQLMLDGVARITVPLADAGQILVGLAASPEVLVVECRPAVRCPEAEPTAPAPLTCWQERFPTPITVRRQPWSAATRNRAVWEAA